jgi:hypothetical protein
MRKCLFGVVAVATLATACSGGASSPTSASFTLSGYDTGSYSYLLGGTAGTIASADTVGWTGTDTHSSPPWHSGASAPFGDNAQAPGACLGMYYSTGTSTGTYLIHTAWPSAPTQNGPTSDLLVTKTFVLPSAMTVKIDVAIDNDIQVFVDGNDVTGNFVANSGLWGGMVGGFQTHTDCAATGSGTFTVSNLQSGTHVLAIHAKDRGLTDYLDAKVYTAP